MSHTEQEPVKKKRGRFFEKGHTFGFKKGNKHGKGRKKGSRSNANLVLDAIGDESAKEIVDVMKEKAKDGDVNAARLLMDRFCPVPKPVTYIQCEAIKNIKTPADVKHAFTKILNEVGWGILALEHAREVRDLVVTQSDFMQIDINNNLKEFEEKLNNMIDQQHTGQTKHV